jgi:hypothetical protein
MTTYQKAATKSCGDLEVEGQAFGPRQVLSVNEWSDSSVELDPSGRYFH